MPPNIQGLHKLKFWRMLLIHLHTVRSKVITYEIIAALIQRCVDESHRISLNFISSNADPDLGIFVI